MSCFLNSGESKCNLTCCLAEGVLVCFNYQNYSDHVNITRPESYELILRWSFSALVSVLGVIGNGAIIFILLKNRLLLRSSINHFILNMSIADFILAVIGPIPFTIREVSWFYPFGEVWCRLEGYLQMVVMLVSVTTLAIISFDRMWGIKYPFHTHLKNWQTYIILLAVWIYSLLMATPFACYRRFTERQWNDTLQKECMEIPKYMNTWWIVEIVLLTWLPLAMMVTCYIIITVNLKKYSKKSEPTGKHQFRVSRLLAPHQKTLIKSRKKIVRMMFAVVVAFICCWLPFQLFVLIRTVLVGAGGQFENESDEKMFNITMTVAQYMIFLTPVIDPIVYGLLHQNFRRAFELTFSKCSKKKPRLVLRKGMGRQTYVWSDASQFDHHQDSDIFPDNMPKNLHRRRKTIMNLEPTNTERIPKETKRGRSISMPAGDLSKVQIPKLSDLCLQSISSRHNTYFPSNRSLKLKDQNPGTIKFISDLFNQVIKEESSGELQSIHL